MEECKVIAIANEKGGVGKTTTTVNLGIGLSKLGYDVLLVDADPQGSLSLSLGLTRPDEIDVSLATLMKAAMDDKYLPEGTGIACVYIIQNRRRKGAVKSSSFSTKTTLDSKIKEAMKKTILNPHETRILLPFPASVPFFF